MKKKQENKSGLGRKPITDGTKKVQFSFYVEERLLDTLGKDACRAFCVDILTEKYNSRTTSKK